jgi:uncharacterized protein YoxC
LLDKQCITIDLESIAMLIEIMFLLCLVGFALLLVLMYQVIKRIRQINNEIKNDRDYVDQDVNDIYKRILEIRDDFTVLNSRFNCIEDSIKKKKRS